MNAYEGKFKHKINSIRQSIFDNRTHISDLQNKIKTHEKVIDSFKMSIDVLTDQTVIDHLMKQIENESNTIESLHKKLDMFNKDKVELENDLLFLMDLCPHENTEFDYEDYHRNITYYKCNMCGKGKL